MRRSLLLVLVFAVATACGGIPHTPPIALGDFAETVSGQTIEIRVLSNDRAPTGDQLQLTGVTGSKGVVEITAENTLRYRTAPGFEGVDQFTYTVTSSQGSVASASVQVIVGPTETTTSTTAGPSLTVTPDRIDFNEVYTTIGDAATVELRAHNSGLTILPFSDGDLDFTPQPDCESLAAGASCTATITWRPLSPTTLDRAIDIAGLASISLLGTAVSPLEASPETIELRLSTPAPEHVLTFQLLNNAEGPVAVGSIAGTGGFEGARITTALPNADPCPLADLAPDHQCTIIVVVDWTRVVVGEEVEGAVTVAFGDSELVVPVVALAIPQAPEWLVPLPGQSVWWELLLQAPEIKWQPLDGIETYRVDAEICLGPESCEEWQADVASTNHAVLQPPPDPDRFAEQIQAALDEGSTPLLRLRVTAIADTPGVIVESDSPWQSYPITTEPFIVIGSIVYDPAPDSCLDPGDRVTVTVTYRSYLMGPATLTATPMADSQRVDFGEPTPAEVVPDPDPPVAIVGFAAESSFDSIRLAVFQVDTVGGVLSSRLRYSQSPSVGYTVSCVE